jgi:DNA repair photolyase
VRRAVSNPPNRFTGTSVEYLEGIKPPAGLRVFQDASRSILSRNDSPDLGFRFSVNPYRGCFHGCAYCYARPSHEYLGFGAGSDFETKLLVKTEAPALLRQAFDKRSWKGDLVLFSGITDCYQPLEATHRLTRASLEVCLAYANPVGIVTKAPLVERDIDVLKALHQVAPLTLTISIPVGEVDAARAVEPYVASPERRLLTIERLAAAGLDVGINVAPFVPGLSERSLADLLRRAKDAGAVRAAYIFLRLPGAVRTVFEERLRERLPDRADKVLARIRDARGGQLSEPRFGHRMKGSGPYGTMIDTLFQSLCREYGLNQRRIARPMHLATFKRPERCATQLAFALS